MNPNWWSFRSGRTPEKSRHFPLTPNQRKPAQLRGRALAAPPPPVHQQEKARENVVNPGRGQRQQETVRKTTSYVPPPATEQRREPPVERALRHLVQGVEPAVDRLGLTLTEVVDIVAAATREVLPGRRLAINELGAEVAELILPRLTVPQREIWIEEGPYAEGQPIGEAVVHFCVRVLALRRIVCFAPRAGNQAPFVLTGARPDPVW